MDKEKVLVSEIQYGAVFVIESNLCRSSNSVTRIVARGQWLR